MAIVRTRTLTAVALLCLALPGGLSAQEDPGKGKVEKENPARDNADERGPVGRGARRQRPDAPGSRRFNPMEKLFELMDADGDGAITAKEMDSFISKVDTDGDGRVNDDELRARMRSFLSTLRPGSPSGRPGGTGGRPRGGIRKRRSLDDPRVSKESAAAANALKQATRSGGLPGPGEAAPDFSLSLLEGSAAPDFVKADGKGKVRLSSHKGKKPVVLIFGSYT